MAGRAEQEAEFALRFGKPRSGLSRGAQKAYDRLVEQRTGEQAQHPPAQAAQTYAASQPPSRQYAQQAQSFSFTPGFPPDRPRSIRRAVWLMPIAIILFTVYSVVNSTLNNDRVMSAAACKASDCHGILLGGAIFGVVSGVVLWLWMMWKLWAGRRWARVLSTVFFAVLCLQFLVAEILTPGVLGLLIAPYFAVALTVLVLLYQPDSSAFFRATKWAGYSMDSRYMPADQPPRQAAVYQRKGWPPRQM